MERSGATKFSFLLLRHPHCKILKYTLMRTPLLTLTILCTVLSSYGQSDTTGFNLGFEQMDGGTNNLPDRWFQWGSGYHLTSDTVVVNSGKVSVRIEPEGEKNANTFGCVARAIPAIYEAAEIEVRAIMKFNNVHEGPIGLMIRIDGSSGVLGFENMMTRNIQGTMDWTTFSVKMPYPEDAKTIFIGAILSGTGQLWVDDFQILLDGRDFREAPHRIQKEYPGEKDHEFDNGSQITIAILSELPVEDLAIVGKIWGFLKYYHPVVTSGKFNWDYELFRLIPKLSAGHGRIERNIILNEWIKAVGTVDETAESEDSIASEVKLQPDMSWIEEEDLGHQLTKSLNSVKEAKRTPNSYYVGQTFGAGNPEFRNEQSYAGMKYPDAGFRLLSLYRYWNIIQYYFPYKNLIGENWNEVLDEYIPKFVNASDELTYKLTVLSLIARIHDTHANIWGVDPILNNYKGERYPPIAVDFVEGKAVVTDYLGQSFGAKSGVNIGDVIEIVNGKAVDEIVAERLIYTPASNLPTQLRDISRDLLRTNDSVVNIEYRRRDKKFSTSLKTLGLNQINPFDRSPAADTCFKLLDHRIAYLYPGRLKNEFLPAIMPEIMKTEGLIIDFRCYPSDFTVFTLSEYLLPRTAPFVKFSTGSIMTPGLFKFVGTLSVGKENPDHYNGKVVIIVNEITQSSAEYHTMAFRIAPGAVVIGTTTAGADGNVSRIILPGGINTAISGIGIYYPDGGETQRIGIVPDIVVTPTIKGIREGRDELLEKAITLILDR